MNSNYKAEFGLLQDFLKSIQIPVTIIEHSDSGNFDKIDLGIYTYFFEHESVKQYLSNISDFFNRQTLYKLTSTLLCKYYLLFLPDMNNTCVCIGPFINSPVTNDTIQKIISFYQIPQSKASALINYYNDIHILTDCSMLHNLLTVFCSRLWGGMDKLSYSEIDMGTFMKSSDEIIFPLQGDADELRNMNILTKRYTLENDIIKAISKGELHNVQMLVSNFSKVQTIENRSSNPLRNEKNYTIIFNTLCRKAAELGKVHPIYINRLSTNFAFKIEDCQTFYELKTLQADMIRKYCLLVRNHSMQHYSELIQNALTIINFDLTANLSLSTLSAQINVNASYLSARFKQELQMTLTEYITQKRVEYAIFLLNSTELTISEIACQCGIPDLQYFSKTFKKRIGLTPSSYKKLIHPTHI